MKIAFDLDDTLIPTTRSFSCGTTVHNGLPRLISKEPLRRGAIPLLKSLSKEHSIWIYTTSLRPQASIKWWFRLMGVSLEGVINHQRHAHDIAHYPNIRYSKYPDMYGIDVLIDDSEGVAMELASQQCHFILVKPEELSWVDNIRKALGFLSNKAPTKNYAR
ncbi:hypothetical protein [Pleionea sp. CnH1-48]|uniref:hypothetical protein n=1 Tax=Pleionea sp. CnH1-48 TaxID=2954494 RepID=UPI002096A490|nr:hypothetical protein [Pleionea sp. CnH1-48]MCO7226194.1 hypothetical protein [Pleionea sp. CnH1-48]